MLIVAVSFFLLSSADVAVTVNSVLASSPAMYNRPVDEIVEVVSLLPDTVQMTDLSANPTVATVAVICRVAPLLRVAVLGDTATLVTLDVWSVYIIALLNGDTLKIFHT